MQLFVDENEKLSGSSLQELIDQLINIVTLCQLIEWSKEPAEIQRYLVLLSDIADRSLKLGQAIQESQAP